MWALESSSFNTINSISLLPEQDFSVWPIRSGPFGLSRFGMSRFGLGRFGLGRFGLGTFLSRHVCT